MFQNELSRMNYRSELSLIETMTLQLNQHKNLCTESHKSFRKQPVRLELTVLASSYHFFVCSIHQTACDRSMGVPSEV